MRPNALPLLAALPAVLLAMQVHFTTGIVYSLDDPYIHLALARQILLGHYGINPGEFSAPSSSILWPFLLAPLTFTRLVEFFPLVLNIASVLLGVWWIQRWLETYTAPLQALLATTAVAFALNFYGLALTGMENSLQVALTAVIGISLMRERFGWPFWLSVVVLPLIRYEGLAISLPALGYIFLAPRQRLLSVQAVLAGTVIAATVGGFSVFLRELGLGILPSSVLAKNGLTFMAELRTSSAFLDNVESQLFFVVIALFAAFLYFREGRLRACLLLVLAPTLLHLMFGRYGWFGRYHIYFATWILIVAFAAYARSAFSRWMPLNLLLVAGFAAASWNAVICTLTTASGSRNIHDQQKQMALIVRDYLDEPVALNDLGFVALYSKRYILDLAGLASYEALTLRADPATDIWIRRLMDRHQVEHALIYDSWFARRPANWIRVATLDLPAPWITVGGDQVAFYSTSPQAAARLRRALVEYRKSSTQAAMMLVLAPQ